MSKTDNLTQEVRQQCAKGIVLALRVAIGGYALSCGTQDLIRMVLQRTHLNWTDAPKLDGDFHKAFLMALSIGLPISTYRTFILSYQIEEKRCCGTLLSGLFGIDVKRDGFPQDEYRGVTYVARAEDHMEWALFNILCQLLHNEGKEYLLSPIQNWHADYPGLLHEGTNLNQET